MASAAKKITRVLLAKFELESHDRGIYAVAKMLEHAGMEVILHVFQKTEEVVGIAEQEDVDVIGVTTSSGDTHLIFLPEIIDQLKKKGMDKTIVIGGGRMIGDDVPILLEKGVRKVFGPGSQRDDIVNFIREAVSIG